jgi:hypothetical protein
VLLIAPSPRTNIQACRQLTDIEIAPRLGVFRAFAFDLDAFGFLSF